MSPFDLSALIDTSIALCLAHVRTGGTYGLLDEKSIAPFVVLFPIFSMYRGFVIFLVSTKIGKLAGLQRIEGVYITADMRPCYPIR